MPQGGAQSKKAARQLAHIKESEKKVGGSEKVAKRIAAPATNKTRRMKGK
ncbi:MAG TPA: hypothetical protein VIN70_02855 [Candidatus Limnocylindria bacterium]|jgi:hypothetical protein